MSTDTTSVPPGQQQQSGYPPLSALRRSRADRKVIGLSGGLGRWAGIDPLVFRVLFVVLTLFGGSGLLLYAVGWLVVPDDGEAESEARRLFSGARASFSTLLALVVVLVVGLSATGALIDSGPGLGGVVVLAVIAVGAVLLVRNSHRPGQGPGFPGQGIQTYQNYPAPGPAASGDTVPLPGDFGQTPGTAYAPGYTAPVFGPPPPPAPTYGAPMVPSAPPLPPRERSVLGRLTLSAALVVVGVLVGWNAAADSDVPARVVLAAALGVVGIGLLVGAYVGRSRGLVVWGLLLTLLVSAAAVSDVPVRGGLGDRVWRPVSAAEVRPVYRLGVGDAELDLTAVDFAAGGRMRVEIRQGVGDLLVIVPDDVVVVVDGAVDAGAMTLPGRAGTDGTDLAERVVVPEGSVSSAAVLVVDAELGVGNLEVRRAAS